MANLQVGIGADSSEFNSEIEKVERKIQRLESQRAIEISLGADTTALDRRLDSTRARLAQLQTAVNSTSQSFQRSGRPIGDASNTLTQFSRIAQDAPFGIMGIGNNLTATAESFANLSRQSGGAGNALRAFGSSLMGGGGVLLAISLVTTALTVMSQKGLTVGDVFNKLIGNFDEFKRELQDVNKEAAKNAASQVQEVKAYTSAAKDINLSMHERLIAVQKLQKEYPDFFGNLTKEQILNGNVSAAVKEVTEAIKAKARAQALSAKLGDLAAKEFELQEKATELQEKFNKATAKTDALLKQIQQNGVIGFNERLNDSWVRSGKQAASYADDLSDVKKELDGVTGKINQLSEKSTANTKAAIKLDFVPPTVKKVKELQDQVSQVFKLNPIGLGSLIEVSPATFNGMFQKSSIAMKTGFDEMVLRIKNAATPMSDALLDFYGGMKKLNDSLISNVFGSMGEAIGSALANGGNVIQAIGSSLLNSMGNLLSSIGDNMIALGAASIATSVLLAAFGTPAGVPLGWAAVALGTALKIGGSFLSGSAKNMQGSGGGKISAGNSVSSPTSSVSNGSSFSGGNVVFEISGQSLVGVLSNTLGKNTKLGGSIAI